MRSVLVTRPQPGADVLAEKLRREGHKAYVAPMMAYAPLQAPPPDFTVYQAIIFTSAYAVESFSRLSPERGLPVLAVGDATAATAQKAGFAEVLSAQGSSADVAALIRQEAPQRGFKKILHPCSADTPDDIAEAVLSLGVEVARLPVYKAELAADFPAGIVDALQRGAIDVVMIFSTRTAENFLQLMEKRKLEALTPKLEVICISRPVAAVLQALPWRALRVASQPKLSSLLQLLEGQAPPERRRTDRRQKEAARDERGHVRSDAYSGPERRQRARRAHAQRQRQRVWKEKVKFLNRASLTAAFMFMAVVLAGVFLMAPEYARLRPPPEEKTSESFLARLKLPSASVGGLVNSGIEKLSHAAAPAATVAEEVASSAIAVMTNPDAAGFSRLLQGVADVRRRAGGDAAVSQAVARLRTMLAQVDSGKPEDVGRAIEAARQGDKTLDGLFGNVRKEDVAAGALLLLLHEFRSDVDNSRPYADDLALLGKFTGNDPYMNRALERLAPYAQSGVMSRQALQGELKGLAGDIVTAQLRGESLSVQAAARQRFEKLSRAASASDVKGPEAEAVVARAQILLDKGDVKGAMRELQSLEGAPAEAARPWMDNAAGHVVAGNSSDDLTRSLLELAVGRGSSSVQGLMDKIKGSFGGNAPAYISPSLKKN
jgi:uroporphyrinogen-III synthase